MHGRLSNKPEFTKSKNMERKNVFFILFCVIDLLNLRFCDTKHLIHNSKEVYVIRYFENQKITPVTVELDLKQQTEHVTSYDQNEGWKSVTFYDFQKKKVAYKDTNSKQCFVADLHGENLDEDRKRLRQINSGIVKGFYIPTLTIQKEITNATEIHERFGHLVHSFCNGSDVSYVTRGSQLSRKKRDTTSSGKIGDRGQFTHHSYGHYGHQSNNYAHYGHETHITGAVDKDGNLRTQKISDHQTRSYGTQTYPPSGVGDMRQSQSTDSRSSSRGPYQQLPSPENGLADNMGIGSTGQFSLQTAQESGYQLNLPFGLKAGNAYRGGIHSQGQYGVGGAKPQIHTSLHRYPGSQITDIVGDLGPGQHERVTGAIQPGGGQISPGLTHTGYPSTVGVGRDSYRPDGSVIRGIDESSRDIRISGVQPGITSPGGIIPGTPGTRDMSTISRDRVTGSHLLPGQRITPSGEIITDSGMISQHIRPPSTGIRPGSYPIGPPGSISMLPSGVQVDQSGRVIPGTPGSLLISPPGSIPTRPGGIQVDESGRVIPSFPDSVTTRPGEIRVDQYGRVIPSFPGSISGGIQIDQSGRVIPGSSGIYPIGTPSSISTRPDGSRVDQLGRVIPGISESYPTAVPGSVSTRPDGTQVDQYGRVIPGFPGSYRPGVPGSISTRPESIQTDQFGRVIPGIPGSYPTGTVGSITTRPDGTQVDQYGRVIPSIPGSISTRPDGTRVDQFGRVIPGIQPEGAIPQDLIGRIPSQIPTGTQISPGYPSGYLSNVPSRETAGIYPGLTSRQVVGDSRLTEQGRVTGTERDRLPISQIQPGDSLRFGGGESASSQTQIQTGSEGTAAEASSAGQYRGLGSQTQVQGGYKGNGSFSAQAQSGFTGGVTQSQVQGGKQGGLSGSSAIVEQVGSAQSQVQIGQPSGAASSSAQGRFSSGSTQVQAQSSRSGGSAGAESQSSGLSSSQVQVNIGGEDVQQQNDFQGTVSASVNGGLTSGQSQTQLQGGYNSGRTYVATAQGGFDSTQGFQGSVPGSGSLPILTTLSGTSGEQQLIRPSGDNLFGTDRTQGRIPGEGRPGQITDLGQLPSSYPGIRQSEAGIGSHDSRYQPGFPQFPLTPQGVHQPSELRPSLPGSFQRGHDSRYPDSVRRPGISDSRLQPGTVPSGFLPTDSRRPGYQPGSVQQPITGVPSSVQISPPHRGLQPPAYQPGSLHLPSDISTGRPSSVQISPSRPGEQVPYQPGMIQPPSQISTGVPSSLHISPPHPKLQQPGYQPGLSQPPSLVSTGIPSSVQISPQRPGLQQPGYQPGSFQHPSSVLISPPRPGLQQPGFQPGSLQPPSTSIPSSVLISPPHPGLQQPGYQPGSIQHPSSVLISPPRPGLQQPGSLQPPFTGIPPSFQISPPRPGLQQPGYHPGLPQQPSHISTGMPSSVQISPPRPGFQQPGYQTGLFQPPSLTPSGIPSSVQISPARPGLQQPGYQPGLFQPESHIPSGIPPSLPGEQFVPGIHRPGILPLPSNVSRSGLPTRPPGVREPDLTDESSCCEALRNLRRRCCDGKNGRADSPCCSRSNKFDNDFDIDDDSDETTNGEPCKVVKAICYIVYKPVGKARICKPTKTNGC